MFDMRQFLASYSKEHREPFNEALFIRSEAKIIDAIKNVILSVTNQDDNMDSRFIIKVNYFNVIDDYMKVKEILFELESEEKEETKESIITFMNLLILKIVM